MSCICPKCKFEYANSLIIRKGSLANLSFLDNIKYNTIKKDEMVTYVDCHRCGYQGAIKKRYSQ